MAPSYMIYKNDLLVVYFYHVAITSCSESLPPTNLHHDSIGDYVIFSQTVLSFILHFNRWRTVGDICFVAVLCLVV